MKSNKTFTMRVTAGFVILYLTIMLSATFLVQKKYLSEFELSYGSWLMHLMNTLQNIEPPKDAEAQEQSAWYSYLLSRELLYLSSEYQHFSAALYNSEKEMEASTQNLLSVSLSGRETQTLAFSLDELLGPDELRALADYQLANYRGQIFCRYRFVTGLSEETNTLRQILVQEITWEQDGTPEKDRYIDSTFSYTDQNGENWMQTASSVVWEWSNPEETGGTDTVFYEAAPLFPGLNYGYKNWQRWTGSTFLHDLVPENDADGMYGLTDYNATFSGPMPAFSRRYKMDLTVTPEGDDRSVFHFIMASECRPWMAAFDYMKYIYLAGFLVMLACIGVILRAFRKLTAKRMALEASRRDFINAAAHEMKTPLGIIRGCAENLLEHTADEKRDYYLQQMIGQTEEMDHLIAEMIFLSQLDAEQLMLSRETISINDLLHRLFEKYAPSIEQKQITVTWNEAAVFSVDGDRNCLEKAFANLADNAVSCCTPGGTIRITTDAHECRIENSCASLSEEELPHLFELFYRGKSDSRGEEKHLGLGLYLTRRILEQHGLQIRLENTASGAEVQVHI